MRNYFLAFFLLPLGTRLAWSETPRASILFTEEQRLNDPETGRPTSRFVDFGTVESVTFDPRENWVLDLKLSSGETRYLVFYGYDAGSKGMQFQVAPERARRFKELLTATTGRFQLVQDGTFASIISILGRGSYDEYHGDETGRVYIPSYAAHLKNFRTNSWTSIDELIETAEKEEAAAAKAAKATRAPTAWPLLMALKNGFFFP
jgi:hypothetical protein